VIFYFIEVREVNEAVNQLFFEEEDYAALKQSIVDYPDFDQLTLAHKLERHELLALRRLGSWLYTQNKVFFF
jgi:clathrin heavy chain